MWLFKNSVRPNIKSAVSIIFCVHYVISMIKALLKANGNDLSLQFYESTHSVLFSAYINC